MLLRIPRVHSAGLLLSYRCSGACRHCLYASSPGWAPDWIHEEDAEVVLAALSETMRGRYFPGETLGLNKGLHFTGGEPFLNFELLLRLVELAKRFSIPCTFVETNAFWCVGDRSTEERLKALKAAGLDGILISVNPFLLEHVPFERTKRAIRAALSSFGPQNTMVYQDVFYEQFRDLGIEGTVPLEDYLRIGGWGLRRAELLLGGRLCYKLGGLFRGRPAEEFFGESCRRELIRDWHVHVDNYCNLIPGYCAGITLGDARELPRLYEGIDLTKRPILRALLTDIRELYRLALEYGYEPREGYISKCHLCLDIRRHLARTGEFRELAPREFYDRLDDGPPALGEAPSSIA